MIKQIINWFKKKKNSVPILHKHKWTEFGESNSPIEDKVLYCKTCNKIGMPRYRDGELIIEVWS